MKVQKVKQMQMHGPMTIPGGLSLGRTVNDVHHKGIQMETHPLGVLIKYRGEEIVVAIVNIQCLVLELLNDQKA